jgi:hypothetical protein
MSKKWPASWLKSWRSSLKAQWKWKTICEKMTSVTSQPQLEKQWPLSLSEKGLAYKPQITLICNDLTCLNERKVKLPSIILKKWKWPLNESYEEGMKLLK